LENLMKTILELLSYACFFGSLLLVLFSPQYGLYGMAAAIYLLLASRE
jgi:hypothetical protein